MRYLLTPLFASFAVVGWCGDFWDQKPPVEWSDTECARLLSDSPWAKPVKASNELSGKLHAGASLNGGLSVGMGSRRNSDTNPEFTVTVRWESAQPIREASRRTSLGKPDRTYIISVTGLPIGADTVEPGNRPWTRVEERLRELTKITLKGGDELHPFLVVAGQEENVIYFYFSGEDAAISATTKEIGFVTQSGPLVFETKFVTKQMKYRGRAAL